MIDFPRAPVAEIDLSYLEAGDHEILKGDQNPVRVAVDGNGLSVFIRVPDDEGEINKVMAALNETKLSVQFKRLYFAASVYGYRYIIVGPAFGPIKGIKRLRDERLEAAARGASTAVNASLNSGSKK